jgi:mRNA interferase MazF
MQEGDIALLKMLQPDGSKKNRPVLLVKQVKPFDDWMVCAVSTQLHQEVKGFDCIILDSDTGFTTTGFKQSSLIRLGIISTVSNSSMPGTIGKISSSLLKNLKQRLAAHIVS